MKLLFDQNISFRILKRIESTFPNATQVRLEGLENLSDKEIWEYARAYNFIIVTFDADFYEFSVIWGSPPKIIWIRTFNQTTQSIADLLLEHADNILALESENTIDCLEIIQK